MAAIAALVALVAGLGWLAIQGQRAPTERPVALRIDLPDGWDANFRPVVQACQVLVDDLGFQLSRRRVTVSTSGLVPQIYRLTEQSNVATPWRSAAWTLASAWP